MIKGKERKWGIKRKRGRGVRGRERVGRFVFFMWLRVIIDEENVRRNKEEEREE